MSVYCILYESEKEYIPYEYLWYNKNMYLGIDYGRVRIGLAVSDTGQIARPIGHIQNKGDKKNLAAIRDVLTKHFKNPAVAHTTSDSGSTKHITPHIVCGLPLLADGTEGDMAREARRFGELLRSSLGASVSYHNERYSSFDAEEYIRDKMGIFNREKIKELVDGVAASMILQGYLDDLHNLRGGLCGQK